MITVRPPHPTLAGGCIWGEALLSPCVRGELEGGPFSLTRPPPQSPPLRLRGGGLALPHTYQAKDGSQAFCSQRACDPRL